MKPTKPTKPIARMHAKCRLLHAPDEPCPTDASPEDYARARRAGHEDYKRALDEVVDELPQAWVFAVDKIDGRWFGVMEMHAPCRPRSPQHKDCTVTERAVNATGFDTAEEAASAVRAWLDGNLPPEIKAHMTEQPDLPDGLRRQGKS